MSRASTTRPLRAAAAVLLATLAVLAVSCSSDDDSGSDTTTTEKKEETTTTSATNAATVRFDKAIQSELAAVGCYRGAVDGIMGPETDAAIVEFQGAAGLTVDGELGPETESKLKEDAAAGKKVCEANASTTTKPATTTTASPAGPACTATAINAALESGQKATSFVCADGWAAGGWTNGQADGAFILQAESGKWVTPAQDPCGSASAGLPPVILQDGCAS
jgi:hypothetical protein